LSSEALYGTTIQEINGKMMISATNSKEAILFLTRKYSHLGLSFVQMDYGVHVVCAGDETVSTGPFTEVLMNRHSGVTRPPSGPSTPPAAHRERGSSSSSPPRARRSSTGRGGRSGHNHSGSRA